MAQLCAMLAGVTAAMQQMQGEIKNEMNGNARQMEEKMDGNTDKMEKMRGEMQNMGAGLQDGLDKLKNREWGTAMGDELGE